MHRDDLPPWTKTLSDLDMKGDWEPAAAGFHSGGA